jgi:hypothetical protein
MAEVDLFDSEGEIFSLPGASLAKHSPKAAAAFLRNPF